MENRFSDLCEGLTMQTEYTKLLKSRTPRSGEGYFDAKRVEIGIYEVLLI